jgi:hypothetical protein
VAELFLHHALSDKKSVKVNITLGQIVPKDADGDTVWILSLGTTTSGTGTNSFVVPYRIHKINATDVDDALEQALVYLYKQIDWEPLSVDVTPPYIYTTVPEDNSDIDISTYVEIKIRDDYMTSGVDMSNMKVILNNGSVDFDITSEVNISGDLYEKILRWDPPERIKSRYAI